MEEKILWKGKPSQWTNLSYYILCVVLSFMVIGIIMAIVRYLATRNHSFEISNERIIETRGVLSQTTDELELYRVKDIKLVEPFWLRMVGLSNLYLVSSDRTDPVIMVPGIPDGKQLRERLRTAIEQRRDVKRVRELAL